MLVTSLKKKLSSFLVMEVRRDSEKSLEELQLNSEILEGTVLNELSQLVFSCIKSKQSL